MESVIVNRFYSRLEKSGLKRHKPSEAEIEFLDSLGDIQQCDAFIDEIDYNISQTRKNSDFALKIAGFVLPLLLVTFVLDFMWLRSALFVVIFIVSSYFYSRFNKERKFLEKEKSATKYMREIFCNNMFK
jgi:hypothetical protein